jgi:23S rRNA (guanine745-N1)-methyltransferase
MNALRCPLCHCSLVKNDAGLACENRHQYDRAKEGYFNLLPVQHKHSLAPGDAKEQLQARRRFLHAGFFSSLKLYLSNLMPDTTQSLLDIGCGEGYFTEGFSDASHQAQIYGMDIAKAGVRLAAKSATTKNRVTYCVASNFDLPLADESMDVVARIFAPSKDSELHRVIKPGGMLVIAAPGDRHLLTLRSRIYKDVRPHAQLPEPNGFVRLSDHRITEDLYIADAEFRAALLAMTPFAWRLAPDVVAATLAEDLHDTTDFSVGIYRKV